MNLPFNPTAAQITEAIRYRTLRRQFRGSRRVARPCPSCGQRCLLDLGPRRPVVCTWCGVVERGAAEKETQAVAEAQFFTALRATRQLAGAERVRIGEAVARGSTGRGGDEDEDGRTGA